MHFETSHVRFERESRCFMIFWHLNNEELLVRDTNEPKLTVQVRVLDLKVVPW